jgi:hypothetical protein
MRYIVCPYIPAAIMRRICGAAHLADTAQLQVCQRRQLPQHAQAVPTQRVEPSIQPAELLKRRERRHVSKPKANQVELAQLAQLG